VRRTTFSERVLLGLGRLVTLLLAIAALNLIIDGIRDV
jgi:hypothetical protein